MSVRSRLDLSSALQRAHRPTARSARKRGGCGTWVAGSVRLPPVRARARRAEARGARASLALAANTAGPSCYTAPGRLDDHPPRRRRRRPLFEDDWRRTLSRSPRDSAKRGARVVVDAAPAHVEPQRDVARYASLTLSLVRERVPSIPLYVFLLASPSQSPLLLRAFVPRAERDLRGTLMILPQVHLRKPCYDFYFL